MEVLRLRKRAAGIDGHRPAGLAGGPGRLALSQFCIGVACLGRGPWLPDARRRCRAKTG